MFESNEILNTGMFVSVIASIALVKHLRQVPHLFVVNLAISDLGVLMMNVFVLIGVFFGDTGRQH